MLPFRRRRVGRDYATGTWDEFLDVAVALQEAVELLMRQAVAKAELGFIAIFLRGAIFFLRRGSLPYGAMMTA